MTRADHIAYVFARLADGTWRNGYSHTECACEWGTTWHYVQDVVADAQRRYALTYEEDRSAVLGGLLAQIEVLWERAMAGDEYGAALGALRLKAQVLRLVGAGTGPTPSPWAALAPEQQAKRIADARAKLDALESNLRAARALPAGGPDDEGKDEAK